MKDALKEIFPPDVPPVVRWRLAMFAAALGFIFHIAWACGLLEPMGLQGFARASSVEQVTAEVDGVKGRLASIQTDLLEQRLFDARLKQCTAETSDARQFYARQVESLYRELYRLNPATRIPDCSEIK